MNYLTNWRTLKAKEILRSEHLLLAEVAERVGYKSEAAFSRAFKRGSYQSPSSHRRANERSGERGTAI
jgi:AraC-like DNA-binding protein